MASVSALVSSATTISTSFITGTGEKKCRPQTRSGRRVHAASSAIGIEDVLEASSVSAGRSSSSCAKRRPLIFGSSTMASTTRSAAARSPIAVVYVTRSMSASAASGSSLPRERARATDAARRSRERASGASSGSWTITCSPAAAADSAIPLPMEPAPTTPTVETSTATSLLTIDASPKV